MPNRVCNLNDKETIQLVLSKDKIVCFFKNDISDMMQTFGIMKNNFGLIQLPGTDCHLTYKTLGKIHDSNNNRIQLHVAQHRAGFLIATIQKRRSSRKKREE